MSRLCRAADRRARPALRGRQSWPTVSGQDTSRSSLPVCRIWRSGAARACPGRACWAPRRGRGWAGRAYAPPRGGA